jgi:hypothetical protein
LIVIEGSAPDEGALGDELVDPPHDTRSAAARAIDATEQAPPRPARVDITLQLMPQCRVRTRLSTESLCLLVGLLGG